MDIDFGRDHFVGRRSDGEIALWHNRHPFGQEQAPTLAAGEPYVQIDATWDMTAARVGPTRTYVSFASGCAGPQPPARLVPRDTPFLGGTHHVRVLDLPQDCSFVGHAAFDLPIPDWPGLVGLSFYNQAIVFDPGANAQGAVVSDAARGVIGRP